MVQGLYWNLIYNIFNLKEMSSLMLTNKEEAEELRIRYKYRRLIMQGEITLPYADAAKLIGPDSAYRLYGTQKTIVKNRKDRSQKKK
jgi:hypothetical protein